MATEKLFTVVGTSTLEGEMKVRFANDVMRVKVLAKHGHTDITLIELDEATDKLSAAKIILAAPEFAGANEQAAIADYIERNTPKEKKVKAEKAPKVAKAPKAAKAKVEAVAAAIVADAVSDADTVAAAEAVIDELDDAPY